MFYKVIYRDRVIDVLDGLSYLKYQEKYNRMVFCDESEAQAILSSNQENIWHVDGLYDAPTSGYDTVQLEEIDEYEYKQLKILNCKTLEETIDVFVLSLIERNTGQFIESLKRLYHKNMICKDKVIKLVNEYKIITDGDKDYILSE